MHRKRISWLAALSLAMVLGGSTAALAAGPFSPLDLFRRVEAAEDKVYPVSEENGPWMIMACSFSGEGAVEQAKALVYELRKSFGLAAYMHQMEFDFGEAHSRVRARFGGQKRAHYLRGQENEEIAVLVGNFPAVDDKKAQGTLQTIKYARPQCLRPDGKHKTHVNLAGWRMVVNQYLYSTSEKRQKGPMGNAFLIPNPLKPKEFFAPSGVDAFVENMNKGVEHCLLDCPGRYTVQVATFRGKSKLEKEEKKKDQESDLKLAAEESKLDDAALMSHQLTEALRAKGYEAYEFHDRYASIVCVGNFNSVGAKRPDGKIEIDPAILKIMETFRADKSQPGAAANTLGVQPKTLGGIPFDAQPIPVEVPRRSLGADYARNPT